MKYLKIISAALSLQATSLAAQDSSAGEAISLERSTEWRLDYADDRCRLAAAFGEGDDRTILLLEQLNPSAKFQWLIAGPYMEGTRAGHEIEVQFGPVFDAYTIEYDDRRFGKFGRAASGQWKPFGYGRDDDATDESPPYEALPTRIDATEGREIRWIGIKRDGKPMLKLETGELESIYQAMNSCLDSLVESWGLDPAQDRRRAMAPIFTNFDSVIQSLVGTYPDSALERGLQADLHLRMMIDESGTATECVITNITSAQRFDDSACKPLMRKGKFEPARDDKGNAMPSYYILDIKYRME